MLSIGSAETLSDGALVALARFDAVIFGAVLPWPLALFLAAASIVIFQNRVLAPWTGWLGALGVLILIVGSLWTFTKDAESVLGEIGAVGIAVTLIWVLVVGIAMLRGVEQAPASHAASPAGAASERAGVELRRG